MSSTPSQAGILTFQTNRELQAHLDVGLRRMGLNLYFQRFLNKLRPAERQIMIP